MQTKKKQTRRSTRSTSAKLAAPVPIAEAESRGDWKQRIVTDEEAERLAAEIFSDCLEATDEADRLARAVFKIVDVLGYEPADTARNATAIRISRAVYARTRDCCEAMDRFAMSAGATFGETYPAENVA